MNGAAGSGRPPGTRPPYWRVALGRAEALRDRPAVAAFIRVTDRYGSAGGAILAGGLAYSALFAVVPAVLLLLGLSGTLLAGELERGQVADLVGGVIPPLRPLLAPALDALAQDAGSISIVGLVALAWGAGGFARALEVALTIVMGEGSPRGFVARTLVSLGSVAVLVVAVVGGAALAGLGAFLQAAVLTGAPGLVSSAAGSVASLAGPALGVLALAVVYRFMPTRAPRWRSVAVPSVVVGLVLAMATRLFVELAPRLIGAAAALGTVATVFAALAWFGLTFQAILLGAAWVADREAARAAVERPA